MLSSRALQVIFWKYSKVLRQSHPSVPILEELFKLVTTDLSKSCTDSDIELYLREAKLPNLDDFTVIEFLRNNCQHITETKLDF